MTEEVKPDVIKKTQDSLKKHIKKPPLTEKLLKKPPFRFLHDIITNVIKETGFLDGLFTTEELNHENIKDRDGKIAFLDKLISAVKIITGIPLSVRATKIVAGHEPTKTNELLQAIGLALDKKLDSKDIALQLRKKGNKKSDAPDSKKSSPREAKQERTEAGKSKSQEKSSNQIEEGSDKKKTSNKQSKGGQEAESDKKKRSSSTSKQPKTKEPSKSVKSKKENIISESKTDPPKEMKEEATIHAQLPDKTPSKEEVPASEAVNSEAEHYRTASRRRSSSARQQIEENSQIQDQQPPATPISPKKTVERKNSPQQKEAPPLPTLPPLHPDQSSNGAPPKSEKPPPASTTSTRAPSAAPTQTSSHPQTQPQVPVPVPLARPRTAARVGSARPGAPRVRNRGEALVVNEEVKAAPVNLIVEDENNKTSHEDEDENLVVVESAPVEGITEDLQPSAPTMSRPSSQQGHLVAQILETQKELEVSKGIDNGEINQHHTEIEWEAGRRRERETAAKEVDRMRSLIQTLTRAAHPLGKLLDSLQEDVDNMQRELSQWQSMQISLEQQLQMEENLSAQASQPLKEQLKQLQQAVRMQLDQISSAKANIISNDERIRRLLTSGQS